MMITGEKNPHMEILDSTCEGRCKPRSRTVSFLSVEMLRKCCLYIVYPDPQKRAFEAIFLFHDFFFSNHLD